MKIRDGYEALWGWFGLSYSSFLTLPRVLMHEMPDKWQAQMAKLLEEYDETFPMRNVESYDTHVSARQHGKYVEVPAELKNYRRPDKAALAKYRE